ncbi:hypothetical protein BV22DRAFT_1187739 [Leucogyrophana mollusca]|uniref:Uncharacterized protein n=1 Tax=Leucogyrophana mollusca TaxID=85980 RepID=A0ACB8AW56_9AGAM|nr:hypothetical protein BV22DRAFT_1187739 [Leucogyrophana mollusca]
MGVRKKVREGGECAGWCERVREVQEGAEMVQEVREGTRRCGTVRKGARRQEKARRAQGGMGGAGRAREGGRGCRAVRGCTRRRWTVSTGVKDRTAVINVENTYLPIRGHDLSELNKHKTNTPDSDGTHNRDRSGSLVVRSGMATLDYNQEDSNGKI